MRQFWKKKWFEAQKRQKKPYAVRKKKQLFASLLPQETWVKIRKLRKKGLELSWEGLYQFVGHILDSVDS
jgi:predicted metalloprotease